MLLRLSTIRVKPIKAVTYNIHTGNVLGRFNRIVCSPTRNQLGSLDIRRKTLLRGNKLANFDQVQKAMYYHDMHAMARAKRMYNNS